MAFWYLVEPYQNSDSKAAESCFELLFDILNKSESSSPRIQLTVTSHSASPSADTRTPCTAKAAATHPVCQHKPSQHKPSARLDLGRRQRNSPPQQSLPGAGEPPWNWKPPEPQQLSSLTEPWNSNLAAGGWIGPTELAQVVSYLLCAPRSQAYTLALLRAAAAPSGCPWHAKHLQLPPWSYNVNTATHTVHFYPSLFIKPLALLVTLTTYSRHQQLELPTLFWESRAP